LTLALDAAGGAKAVLTGIGKQETPQEILAELEYADPNGEVLTSSSRVALWPAKIVLGIKPDSWALSKDRVKFETLALDIAGKPLSALRSSSMYSSASVLSHRTRLVGGFYAYHSGVDVKRLQTACEGTTDEHGRLFCDSLRPWRARSWCRRAHATTRESGRDQHIGLGRRQRRMVVRRFQ
jgi:hypothetical protein